MGRFETLIYTDCRPGQGLQGSAGLQFQARSAESATAAMPAVQRHLLYEAPNRWMAQRRPVESYPRSFAHVWDGQFVTAAGCYLGKEANGGREGNQLTHSIVTDDPGAYGSLRPAQLYGAAFWRTAPADSTTCEPLEAGWSARPTTPAQARGFVLAQPEGVETLRALVAALDQADRPDARRVLFVSSDMDGVMRWLVAGTLLLPQDRALRLGFKIYSTNPAYSSLPVLAVHPEWAGSAGRLDNDLGYVVFDLDGGAHSAVGPAATTDPWVELFCGDDDPRDVVDALDVAAASEVPDPAVAASVGISAIMHRLPEPTHAEPVVDWLRHGPERLRHAYGADIADLFSETPQDWTRSLLEKLDAVGGDGLLPGRAGAVRLALLHREVEHILGGPVAGDRRPPPPRLPDGEWTADHQREAEDLVLAALNGRPRPAGFAALLALAARFALPLRFPDIREAAYEFVRYWADHPAEPYRPADWPCGDELEDQLVDELQHRAEVSADQRRRVGAAWWRWLLPRLAALDGPLSAAVLGAAVLHHEDRGGFVAQRLAEARHDPVAFAATAAGLWSQIGPTTRELRQVLHDAPEGCELPAATCAGLVQRVLNDSLTVADLNLCRELVRRRLLVPDAALRQLLEDDAGLRAACDKMLVDPVPELQKLLDWTDVYKQRLVRLHVDRLCTSLLQLDASYDVYELLDAIPLLFKPYLARLEAELATGRAVRHVVIGFAIARRMPADLRHSRDGLWEAVDRWLVCAPDRLLKQATQRWKKFHPAWEEAWQERLDQVRGRRRRYRVTHPFGGG